MTAVRRIRQGVRALLAFSQPVDYALAAAHLPPDLLALFRQMRRSEQLHCLNVLRDVMAQSSTTPDDLATAALLHDVGKSRYLLMVWQKTLIVLVRAFAPPLYHRWACGNPDNLWQRPFVVSARHPQWSADMIATASASEGAIWLVRHHQDPADQHANHSYFHLLKRLQQADDAN